MYTHVCMHMCTHTHCSALLDSSLLTLSDHSFCSVRSQITSPNILDTRRAIQTHQHLHDYSRQYRGQQPAFESGAILACDGDQGGKGHHAMQHERELLGFEKSSGSGLCPALVISITAPQPGNLVDRLPRRCTTSSCVCQS